jgi:hypothetical protein
LSIRKEQYIDEQITYRVLVREIILTESIKNEFVLGSSGSANNQLNTPSALVRNSTDGTLYIADTGNHRIMCYLLGASSGTVAAGGNGAGTGTTQLNYPYGFTIDTNTNSFIIANYASNTVVRWVMGASSWTLLAGSAAGTGGSTSTLLGNPLNVVLDSYGNMYVSDSSNHRIQFFLAGQSNGTTIAGVTNSAGATPTQLYYPYWVILDSQLNLYVADSYNYRVQKFSRY